MLHSKGFSGHWTQKQFGVVVKLLVLQVFEAAKREKSKWTGWPFMLSLNIT